MTAGSGGSGGFAGSDADPATARLASAFLDAAAVMDQLRSPGGCPWDAEQTNASLAPYAVEEAYEAAEAAEVGDLPALREELGDLLLQVLFQARVASEVDPAEGGFSVADVAEGLAAKLRRRHPHVFADASGERTVAADADAVNRQWEQIKAAEKGGGGGGADARSVLDGVPEALPALMRAQKVLRRAHRAGIAVGPVFPGDAGFGDEAGAVNSADAAGAEIGAELVALVARAEAAGVDAEAALRAQVRAMSAQVRAAE